MSETAKERRFEHRRGTSLKTTLTQDGYARSCRLVNISTKGALIAASFHPRVGARVELDLPGYESTLATVTRVTSAYIALSFNEPVDIDLVTCNNATGNGPVIAAA